jgi:hypothetical protein
MPIISLKVPWAGGALQEEDVKLGTDKWKMSLETGKIEKMKEIEVNRSMPNAGEKRQTAQGGYLLFFKWECTINF